VHFVAKVGKDQFSNLAADHLTRSDITLTLYQSESEPTGNAIIYVSQENGENMIAIYSGANTTITIMKFRQLFRSYLHLMFY
jgi:sugar/nucleoside kinase (ribokinase family)